jgi:ribosomal protein S21
MKEFKVGPNDNISKVLTKFKKKIRESKILVEMQERQYFEPPSAKKRKKRSKSQFRQKLNKIKDDSNL